MRAYYPGANYRREECIINGPENSYTGDFTLKKRYCPGLGRNVPIMVQSVSPFCETCLSGEECGGQCRFGCSKAAVKDEREAAAEKLRETEL